VVPMTSDPSGGEAPAPRRTSRSPSLRELEAVAAHANQRAALYRRKVLLGRGEPGRLAELERIAAGAANRLRRARETGSAP